VDFALMSADSPGFDEWALKYAQSSPDGIGHARAILAKTNQMLRSGPTMTEADLAEIPVPVLVLAGDDDVATLAHTASLFEALPDAQLAIVPGASHAVLKEHTEDCVRVITRFLSQRLPVATLSPLRRAPKGEFPGD
jgi:pimeloyl-ACP methyl ester carboxylesterase